MSKGHGDEGEKPSSFGNVCADLPGKNLNEIRGADLKNHRRIRIGFFPSSRF
jgi:hypothetical protein